MPFSSDGRTAKNCCGLRGEKKENHDKVETKNNGPQRSFSTCGVSVRPIVVRTVPFERLDGSKIKFRALCCLYLADFTLILCFYIYILSPSTRVPFSFCRCVATMRASAAGATNTSLPTSCRVQLTPLPPHCSHLRYYRRYHIICCEH